MFGWPLLKPAAFGPNIWIIMSLKSWLGPKFGAADGNRRLGVRGAAAWIGSARLKFWKTSGVALSAARRRIRQRDRRSQDRDRRDRRNVRASDELPEPDSRRRGDHNGGAGAARRACGRCRRRRGEEDGAEERAAVVGCDRLTVVPATLTTVVMSAIPAPSTICPGTMPVAEATVRLVPPLLAVPVVVTGAVAEKSTGVAESAAVVACDRLTVVPSILLTVVFAAIPAPITNWPDAMPFATATVRLLVALFAVPVVVTTGVAGEKSTGVAARAAVVGCDKVTIAGATLCTVEFAAMPVPLTACPAAMATGDATARLAVALAAEAIVVV